jgi:hypothetical protein
MFRKIGHYEITRDGDLIRVRSTAEFNLEAAQQYSLDMNQLIEQMPATFATLVEFDAPPVVGPEVEASMRRSAHERGERGMVAVAFITACKEGIRVANAQWDRIYEGSRIVFRVFDDVPTAKAWLLEQVARARE